jgi:MinD superfamily P-loop ATPase
MFRIAVASGKGGTGKTCVASSLALVAGDVLAVDADVEEPNLAIVLGVEMRHLLEVTIPLPVPDVDKCIMCGQCAESCRFGAIALLGNKPPLVNSSLCNGCGACSIVCPAAAITESKRGIGEIGYGEKGTLKILEGRLRVGVNSAIPVIENTLDEAEKRDTLHIIDCPPGTSCPMVAAIGRSDFVVLVTEPTPFGLEDLSLALSVVHDLRIPAGIVVNRSDLSTADPGILCEKFGVEVLARLPFSKAIAKGYAAGISPVKVDSTWKVAMRKILSKATEAVR